MKHIIAMFTLTSAFVIALVTTTACPGPTPIPVQDVIDCVKVEGTAGWQSVQSVLMTDALTKDWSKLTADTESAGLKFGFDTARCVAMELIQQYLSTKQADITSTHDAHDAGEAIRKKASGATFRTKYGDL